MSSYEFRNTNERCARVGNLSMLFAALFKIQSHFLDDGAGHGVGSI